MKVVILAGGKGTRLAEETQLRPKPMVEVGGRPLLWHIMKTYADHGFKEFIICLGYKKEYIINYFLNYHGYNADLEINLGTGEYTPLGSRAEDWKVTLINTGLDTMTSGRIKQVLPYTNNEPFFLTYGDGLANADITAELEFHKQAKTIGTVLAVRPSARFGALHLEEENKVTRFAEKPVTESGLINGGFFVLEPEIASYLGNDSMMPFEQAPLQKLAEDRELTAYEHDGFWQPCDTLRDKELLDSMWQKGNPPWVSRSPV